jgi:hypothetical protein
VMVRLSGEWLVLDNRRLALVRGADLTGATPRFLLDDHGVSRFDAYAGLPLMFRRAQQSVVARLVTWLTMPN